jgi:outer membrane protease
MKKLWLPFLVFITVGVSVSAQSAGASGYRVSLGTSLGLLTGKGEEIVYRDKRTKNKLSQLLWEFNALLYAGLDANYTWQKPGADWGVFAGASFKGGFPATAGVMEDRDWMDSNSPGWLTHYSVHDNKTEEALLLDVCFGVSLRIFEKFWLKPAVAYSFMRFSWTANGGSLLYPQSGGGHDYFSPIDVGTYRQAWHIVSGALAFSGEFNRYFDIELSLKLGPSVWFSGEDHHLLRDLVITENLTGGFFIEPGLRVSFKPSETFTLSFSAACRSISGSRGDGKYDFANEPDLVAKNMSGAGYSAWDTGITATYTVGNSGVPQLTIMKRRIFPYR